MNWKCPLLGALATLASATGSLAEPNKYCAGIGAMPMAWNLPVLQTCVSEWTGERRVLAGMLMRAWERTQRLQDDNDRLRGELRDLRSAASVPPDTSKRNSD